MSDRQTSSDRHLLRFWSAAEAPAEFRKHMLLSLTEGWMVQIPAELADDAFLRCILQINGLEQVSGSVRLPDGSCLLYGHFACEEPDFKN